MREYLAEASKQTGPSSLARKPAAGGQAAELSAAPAAARAGNQTLNAMLRQQGAARSPGGAGGSGPGQAGPGGGGQSEARAAEALKLGMTGSEGRLPHMDRLAQQFPQGLERVRCFFGAPAKQACAMMGAEAFTVGNVIIFSKESPPLDLVAHELTHVVQQGGHEPGGAMSSAPDRLPTSSPGGEMERQAERKAQQVVSTSPGEVREAERLASSGPMLQPSLSDDLNNALDGWSPDATAIVNSINGAPQTEREEVLRDPRLMARLRDKLSAADALRALNALNAPLTLRLDVALSGWSVDATALIQMIHDAPQDQKEAVLREPTLIAKLRSKLSRADAIRALTELGAPLTERINAAMEGWGCDAQAIIDLATNATDAERQTAMRDRGLIDRLKSELDRTQMLQVLEALNASLVDRLNVAMDGWGVDAQAIIDMTASATDVQKQQALADSELMGRLRQELDRSQALQVLTNLDASLADRLNVAMDGWGTDEAAIRTMIEGADEAQRMTAHDDAALLARLKSELSEDEYWQARLMLRFGDQATIDAASSAVPAMSNGTHYRVEVHIADGELQEALTAAVTHFEGSGALNSANYGSINYTGAGAPGLEGECTARFKHDTASNRWVADGAITINIYDPAFADAAWLCRVILHEHEHAQQYTAGFTENPAGNDPLLNELEVQVYLWEIDNANRTGVGNDQARMADLGGRLTHYFNGMDATRQATYQARYQAALATVAAVAPGGGATTTAESLTAQLSAHLAASPPNHGQIMAAISGASAADKEAVRGNSDLMSRLAAVLTQDEMRQAMTDLGVPLVERLNLLVRQRAAIADFTAVLQGATDADKASVLDNRELLERIFAVLSAADQQTFMDALGDSLPNRIRQALQDGSASEATIAALIGPADAAAREQAERDTALLGELSTRFGAVEYWHLRLLLRYGPEASIPAPATALLTVLRATPTYSEIRRCIVQMSTPDHTTLKAVIGVHEVLRAVITDDTEHMNILRVLDQGLISEETDHDRSFNETLLSDPTAPGQPFQAGNFGATSKFDITYYRDKLEVTVRIKLSGADATARAGLSASKSTCEGLIEGRWNGTGFQVRNINHTLPLRFNAFFTSSSPHQSVDLHTGNPVWPGYNMSNWYTVDLNPCIHEFGHMIGNPDEYWRPNAEYQALVGDPATTPNTQTDVDATGQTRHTNTTSLMGTGGGAAGTIERRHVEFLLQWINNNRRKNPDGTFAEPAFTLIP